MGKFLIRQVATGVKFDLKAANGETVATSEVYKTEAACRKGVESVCRSAPKARLEDRTEPDAPTQTSPKFVLYQDRSGAYRFRLCARNGHIIAVSEAYSTKSACLDGIESVKKNAISSENAENCGNCY